MTYIEKYKNKNVLITGGLGFLGSNLAHRLVDLGASVAIMDALLPLYGGNLFNVEDIREKVAVNISDIREEASINHLVEGKDYIFHIAAQTSHVDSMIDPFTDIDINCRGNMIFLEACRKHSPQVKIIYAGTRGQYGRLEYTPVDEKHKMEPVDIYGVNKMAGEHYHFLYHRIHGIKATSLRINNTYGPRHQMKHGKYGILNWFIKLALDGATIKVYGEGNQLRDYNYVDDVIEAFLLAGAADGAYGQAFNLGSGSPVKFIELVEKVIKAAGNGKYEKVPWPKERADIEVGDYIADYGKFQKLTGWTPKVFLDEGLKSTVEYYKKYKENYW